MLREASKAVASRRAQQLLLHHPHLLPAAGPGNTGLLGNSRLFAQLPGQGSAERDTAAARAAAQDLASAAEDSVSCSCRSCYLLLCWPSLLAATTRAVLAS